MNNTKNKTAFSPLRLGLMIFIVLCLIASIIAFSFHGESWAHYLGIFSTVFIMLTVFMQFLELVWLNSIRRSSENSITRSSYKNAMLVYLVLLILGISISILVLKQMI